MCEFPNYFLRLKDKYDIKYQLTGTRTKLVYLAPVHSVENGTYKLSYNKDKYDLIVRDCGQCRTCRFKKARVKAVQVQCECKSHKDNSFITLTFDSKKIYDFFVNEGISKKSPYARMKNAQRKVNILTWTLEKKLFQKFMKKFRFNLEQEYLREYSISHGYFDNYITKKGELRDRIIKHDYYDYSDYNPPLVKFYHAGEYGELNQRPHHHAILLGWNSKGNDVYYEEQYSYKRKRHEKIKRSYLLDKCWPFGKNQVGTATYQSMNYVARYCTKKIKGKMSEVHYNGRMPEYETASNRTGLGFEDFKNNYIQYMCTRGIPYRDVHGNIEFSPLPNYFKVVLKRYYPALYRQFMAECYKYSQQYNDLTPAQIVSRSRKQANVSNDVFNQIGVSEFRSDLENCTQETKILADNIQKRTIFGIDNDLHLKSFRDIGECRNDLSYRSKKFIEFENNRKKRITELKRQIIENRIKNNYSDLGLTIPVQKSLMKQIEDVSNWENPYKKDNFTIDRMIKEVFCV